MEGMLGALSFRCQRWDEAVKRGTAKTDHLPVLQHHGWRRAGVGLADISRTQDGVGQLTSKRRIHLTLFLKAVVCVSR